eukprot:GHVS01096387.1.p1 GENE.GHVS01096387.1~~GHVS01096387.1.p1  ORF type:complete len:307 (-),score=84.47 GHVS01096387.1:98-1018(-)
MAVVVAGRSSGEWKALTKLKTCLDSPYMMQWPEPADPEAHDELLQALQQNPPPAPSVRLGLNSTACSLDSTPVAAVVLFSDHNCAALLRHIITMCSLKEVPYLILEKQSQCHQFLLQHFDIHSVSSVALLEASAVAAAVATHAASVRIPFFYPQLHTGRSPLLLPSVVRLQTGASLLHDFTKRPAKRKHASLPSEAAPEGPTRAMGIGTSGPRVESSCGSSGSMGASGGIDGSGGTGGSGGMGGSGGSGDVSMGVSGCVTSSGGSGGISMCSSGGSGFGVTRRKERRALRKADRMQQRKATEKRQR